MAKKPNITTIASGYYSRLKLNENFENLRNGFDNTLSLDGSTPNAMGADLDFNNNNAVNIASLDAQTITLAGSVTDLSDIQTLTGISQDIQTLADIEDGTDATDAIQTAASVSSDITTVSGISSVITTVSGISSDVTAVSGISSDVTTVASNVSDVTNFADVYLGPAASDPATRNDGSALQEGDLYFNTSSELMRVYDGARFVNGTAPVSSFAATLLDDDSQEEAQQTLGTPVWKTDVDAALADTSTYTTGTIIRTREEGFAYRAVDTATATTVANAGGQAFEVLEENSGMKNALAYGVPNNGALATVTLQKALDDTGVLFVPFILAGYVTGQLSVPNGKKITCASGVVFKAAENTNDELFVNATQPSTGIEILGYPVIDSDYLNQSLPDESKSLAFTDVSESTIEVISKNCGSHGVIIRNGGDADGRNKLRVICRDVGKTKSGYGLYLFNTNNNEISIDIDGATIGLAVEASGAGKTSNFNDVKSLTCKGVVLGNALNSAGVQIEQSAGGQVKGTILRGPVIRDGEKTGITITNAEDTRIYNPELTGNGLAGFTALNAVNFLIDGGAITGNGASASAGSQAQVKLDSTGLAGSTGVIRNCGGSGTVEGVKMFSDSDVRFENTDFRGTTTDYNTQPAATVDPVLTQKPAFSAELSTDLTSAGYVVFDSETWDRTGAYNPSTGTFTAPITGFYSLSAAGFADAASDRVWISLRVNGANVARAQNNGDTTGQTTASISHTIKLNRGDVVRVYLDAGGLSGDAARTRFSGFKL